MTKTKNDAEVGKKTEIKNNDEYIKRNKLLPVLAAACIMSICIGLIGGAIITEKDMFLVNYKSNDGLTDSDKNFIVFSINSADICARFGLKSNLYVSVDDNNIAYGIPICVK